MVRTRRREHQRPLVLLLTHSGDFYTIDRVQHALQQRGVRAVRVDTDLFPTRFRLVTHLTSNGSRVAFENERGRFELNDTKAVWQRRLWSPTLPASLSAQQSATARAACWAGLTDSLSTLTRARWVNDIGAEQRAESKIAQLHVANACGLVAPETYVTNSAAAVSALGKSSKLITKLLRPAVQSMRAHKDFEYTRVVDLKSLDRDALLPFRPQIFQPLIAKAYELRVVVVGRRVFVGGIDTRNSAAGQIDWRLAQKYEHAGWFERTLPSSLERGCKRMLKHFGLVSGVFDFIVTPKGEHVFLELNPAGEWGWLERDLGFDISAAFADALVGTKT